MNSLLPPLILGLIVLFIYAFIREARRQKNKTSDLFKKIAETHSWTYWETDKGQVQEILRDFQAVGNFYSPSLGKLPPKNVIIGAVPQGTFCFFQHMRRYDEDFAFHFNGVAIQLNQFLTESLIIRFMKGKSRLTNYFYTDFECPISEKWSKQILVYGQDKNESISRLDDTRLKTLIEHADALPWRVDLQIQKDRMAVYTAERNADIENETDFIQLKEFAQKAIEVLKNN